AILAQLRERFPEEPELIFRAARLLKESGHLDEADALLETGSRKHRQNLGFHLQRAWLAHERRDFAAAVERWAELREALPDHPAGYHGAAASLREAGRLDDAEAVAAAGMQKFPDDPGIADEYARIALARR